MNNMVEIFEPQKICITLCYDMYVAFNNFLQYYNWKENILNKKQDCYVDLYEQITTKIGKGLFCEDNIETIYLSETLDENLLDIIINLIRKEIYGTGLKIVLNKDNRTIYMWYEGVINNKPYYVEDEKEIKVLKSLNYKSKWYKPEY